MTTPPRKAGRPVKRVCLCAAKLKGRAQAIGEGKGWAESKPGRTGGCGNRWRAEGTCFREQVDKIMGGTGGRWKEQEGRERRG